MSEEEFNETQRTYLDFYEGRNNKIFCLGKNNLNQLRKALKDYKFTDDE